MKGTAVATVIGQVATAILAVWYLLNMRIIKPARGAMPCAEASAGVCLGIDKCVDIIAGLF